MDIFTAVIVYLMLWWTVLFAVLPWGNRLDEDNQLGNIVSAPKTPNLKKKFLITSAISLVLLGIIATLIELNVMDFRAIGTAMIEEDLK